MVRFTFDKALSLKKKASKVNLLDTHSFTKVPSITSSKNHNCSGRSMIEILTVLAIIGILSIAAVAGIQWALAKYKANNTMHDVHIWAMAALDNAQLYTMTEGDLVLKELGEYSTHGYPIGVHIENEQIFHIYVEEVPSRVCSLMLDMQDENMSISVNDLRYEGTNKDICDGDALPMKFYLSKSMENTNNICIPTCTAGQRCCNNVCRDITTPCGPDGCIDCGEGYYCTTSNTCCTNANAIKCGDNNCCETSCCNGECCASAEMTCNSEGKCGCPDGTFWNEKEQKCGCPEGTTYQSNSKGEWTCCEANTYYFENENICCPSASVPVNGTCLKVECQGTSCYINDKLCGSDCTGTENIKTITCGTGICNSDLCTGAEKFVEMTEGMCGPWQWGCKMPSKYGLDNCYWNGNISFCYENPSLQGAYSASCMQGLTRDLESRRGVCENNLCEQTNGGTPYKGFQCHAGCSWEIENLTVQCYPVYNKNDISYWYCYNNGGLCSTSCKNPPSCDGDCNKLSCPSGSTYDEENGMCCQEGTNICCPMIGNSFSCYKKENNDLKQCGQNCTSFTSCAQGSCENPPCPSDFTYEYDETRNVYGCRKKTERNIFCWYRDGTYDCRYAGDSADCTNCDLENLETNGCYYMPLGSKCTPSGLCSHGSKIENCTCIGTITETESGSYCCQKNHTYVNGGCTLLTNP